MLIYLSIIIFEAFIMRIKSTKNIKHLLIFMVFH